ncbi:MULTISPECIES: PEGA domain-containing protein [unclassified Treponema]|uniref:PEGA domain-containing protein n=1 Tax=unclassified Treponema TaxID=2638727 RepID=UPI0025D5A908|nr:MULTISPECIES: PEGA domain-containing protein [unclassified Treponema]
MKRRKIFLKILTALFSLCLLSCASTPEKKIDSMYVMVYDYASSELMNASVFIDGKEIGKTDIYGRLMYPCEKETTICVRKDGYETVETKAAIKPGTVLYFKMGNGSYYAEQAEKLLDGKDFSGALKMIDKALGIEERKDWQYLRKIIIRERKNDE